MTNSWPLMIELRWAIHRGRPPAGKPDEKSAALAFARLDPDAAMMPLDNARDDRQAEALAGSNCRMDPLEDLEDFLVLGGWDSQPIIGDEIGYRAFWLVGVARLGAANFDLTRTSRIEEGQCVADQVGKDLLEGGRIAPDARQIADANRGAFLNDGRL